EKCLSGLYRDRLERFLFEMRQAFLDGGGVLARQRQGCKHCPLHLRTDTLRPAICIRPIHLQAGRTRETSKRGIRHGKRHAQVVKGGIKSPFVSPQISFPDCGGTGTAVDPRLAAITRMSLSFSHCASNALSPMARACAARAVLISGVTYFRRTASRRRKSFRQESASGASRTGSLAAKLSDALGSGISLPWAGSAKAANSRRRPSRTNHAS